MAVSLGDIVVRFLGDVSDLHKGVEESTGMLGGFGGLAADVAVKAGESLLEIGVESTKMAGDFQAAMLSNVAHAGLAKDQINAVSQSVMQMASQVGRSPTQLAEALYPILTAFSGIQNQAAKSAISLDTLKMSFQTVAGTTVDGTAVANAAVGTFNALGLATNNVSTNTARMTSLFDVMDKTVQLGNMQWDAYKSVVSKLAVSIQGTGITFNESQAALAEMTNEGFTAQRASTYLANAFNTLAIKTDTLAKHAKNLSIPFNESAYAGMDLAHKIEYLNQVTDGNKQKLLALMSNNSTALKTFNALSTGIDGYRSNLAALTHSQGALKSSFDEASKGFDFQMSQMKAAGDALMVTLGTAFLPVLTQMVGAITPMIQQFTAWETKTHGIEAGMAAVGTAAMTVATTIATVVGFFQKNQLAADLLVGSLAGLTAAIIAANASAIIATITAIPAVVVGFGAWAVAAGAAAIATLAAAAPFIAIGIAVALVVAGIILAIQHWGEITTFLQGVWAGFASWFMSALSAVGSFFTGVWNGITAFFQNSLNVLITIGKIGFQVLYYAAFGPILAIGAAFQWLYNHNYYFKDLIDTITGWTKSGVSWMQGAWQATTTWIGARWNDLARAAAPVWAGISHTTQTATTATGNWITSAWNATAAFTVRIWNSISSSVASAWRTISGIIGGAWNTYIAGPLGGLWSRFTGWFGNLAGMAIQWGANLISSFGKGIVSSLGSLGNSLSQAAGTVTKFLGFHSPTELGPGRDADKWAPNLIKMYAGGIVAGVPQIASASSALVAPLAPRLSTPSSGGSSARSQTAHIHVYLGGKEIVSQLMPMVYDEARAMTGWRPVG